MSAPNLSDFRLRLTPEQCRAIERLAARDQVSPEEAVIRAVEQALAAEADASAFPPGTPFHGLDDLLSTLGEGPADLSTNRSYLDDLGT
ncbi:hypothetical protein AWN76_009365 [Rhodothermaceae bacterium RA]|nr:hypothetical protein AWN76_009365 [Rhodothermaceae bacterium RA]